MESKFEVVINIKERGGENKIVGNTFAFTVKSLDEAKAILHEVCQSAARTRQQLGYAD